MPALSSILRLHIVFFPISLACTHTAERRQMHYAAHNRTVTFLPENDMMGHMFDSHGGLVQTMTCNTDHLGPVGCHLLENTICNLISHCGEREHVQERGPEERGSERRGGVALKEA
jgi:hypothetical protein